MRINRPTAPVSPGASSSSDSGESSKQDPGNGGNADAQPEAREAPEAPEASEAHQAPAAPEAPQTRAPLRDPYPEDYFRLAVFSELHARQIASACRRMAALLDASVSAFGFPRGTPNSPASLAAAQARSIARQMDMAGAAALRGSPLDQRIATEKVMAFMNELDDRIEDRTNDVLAVPNELAPDRIEHLRALDALDRELARLTKLSEQRYVSPVIPASDIRQMRAQMRQVTRMMHLASRRIHPGPAEAHTLAHEQAMELITARITLDRLVRSWCIGSDVYGFDLVADRQELAEPLESVCVVCDDRCSGGASGEEDFAAIREGCFALLARFDAIALASIALPDPVAP